MNANELADELINWYPKVNLCVASAITLRQQEAEIGRLKLRELSAEEILDVAIDTNIGGSDQSVLDFARALLKKANEK